MTPTTRQRNRSNAISTQPTAGSDVARVIRSEELLCGNGLAALEPHDEYDAGCETRLGKLILTK